MYDWNNRRGSGNLLCAPPVAKDVPFSGFLGIDGLEIYLLYETNHNQGKYPCIARSLRV